MSGKRVAHLQFSVLHSTRRRGSRRHETLLTSARLVDASCAVVHVEQCVIAGRMRGRFNPVVDSCRMSGGLIGHVIGK